jgi:hypothetical protein
LSSRREKKDESGRDKVKRVGGGMERVGERNLGGRKASEVG